MMGETVTLTAADGLTISAYRALPSGKPKGGVVVL
jgi:carboxymethylenebutenolidase